MSLELRLTQELSPSGEQKLELSQDRMGKIYEIIDFYDHQPKITHKVMLGGKEKEIKYVMAPPSWLHYIENDERFGAYIGDMMFINSDTQQVKPEWVPYVAFKLAIEKEVDRGLDESGRTKHWASLFATLRIAGMTMPEGKLNDFLQELAKHEHSGYLELDEELREFLERHDNDRLEAKRRYLENHRHNKWVAKGRTEEFFIDEGLFDIVGGFRNHSEAIMSAVRDLDLKNLYLFSHFIYTLRGAEPGQPILIEPPYTSFAYALTKEGNGVVDLVDFCDTTFQDEIRGKDLVIIRDGRRKTWEALGKRLSYRAHKAEEAARMMIEDKKGRLDNLLIESRGLSILTMGEIEKLREEVVKSYVPFAEAREKIEALSGDYKRQLKEFGDLTESVATSIAGLEEVSSILKGII